MLLTIRLVAVAFPAAVILNLLGYRLVGGITIVSCVTALGLIGMGDGDNWHKLRTRPEDP